MVLLYYYRARYYSTALGRFLQTDPIGARDDLNLYTYLGGDPVNATDPMGMEKESDKDSKKEENKKKRPPRRDRKWDFASKQGKYARAAQSTGSSSGTPDDGEHYSPGGKGWHDYTVTNEVCTAAQACDEQEVTDQLSRHAYPGQDPNSPVADGGRYMVYDEVTGLPGGIVTTRVSEDGLTIVNTTTPLHILYNGRIVRTAFETDGSWFVTTHGVGNNVVPGMATANQYWGPVQFNRLDARLRQALETMN